MSYANRLESNTIASVLKCLKFASADGVKPYPANFTMGSLWWWPTADTGWALLFPVHAWCREQGWGTGMLPRAFQWAGRHFALSLSKLYPNQRKQRAGFEDTVNFALTAGGRVKQWQPAIRDRREENKKWWRETAAAQRVHSVPLLRSLKVPYWGKETIKMFIKKNITLGIYYWLQVFISRHPRDVFQ